MLFTDTPILSLQAHGRIVCPRGICFGECKLEEAIHLTSHQTLMVCAQIPILSLFIFFSTMATRATPERDALSAGS